tara:strand:- start:3800 stop:4408 length:609 start_codon:yes stop_codon:yes gene_type:complete
MRVDFVKVDLKMLDLKWAVKYCGEWEKRREDIPFYTIGKSAYLDGLTDRYYKHKDRLNAALMKIGPIMYEKVLGVLSGYFKEDVSLDDDLAYPGFHIFVNHPILMTTSGNWHCDIPHETLGLGCEDAYTFTLAVEMPEGGGGIDVYNEKDDHEYVEHKVGYMMLHDGESVHRIASLKENGGKPRITLQGHIIRKEGKLVAFW